MVESQKPPELKIEERKQSPVIFLNGSWLLGVTKSDAVLGNTPKEQAEMLYFRIEAVLQRHQIEIPFPQQDLHMRSGALPIELSPQLEQ